MIVIALGNRARHGKGGAAKAIEDHCHRILKPVLHIGWADALRREVAEAIALAGGSVTELLKQGTFETVPLNITGTMYTKNIIVSPGAVGRRHTLFPDWVKPDPKPMIEPLSPYGKHPLLLQWWGTDYRRAQDVNYWVKRGVETIKAFEKKHPGGVALVSDTRFVNEVEAIKAMGGYAMNVTRLNADGSPFRDPFRDANHISERELDNYNWDFHITVKEGDTALKGELAITIFEYIRGLKGI